MKFTVSALQLCERLQILKDAIVPNSGNVSLFDHILFDFRGGILYLTASNRELSIKSQLETSDGEGEGKVAIMPTYLLPLSYYGDVPVVFNIDESNFQVNMEVPKGKASFIATSAEEYPANSNLEENKFGVSLNLDKLKFGLSVVMMALPTDNLRPKFNGVYFDFVDNKLVLVATNSVRLVRFSINDVVAENASSGLVTINQMHLLEKIIAKNETDTIKVEMNDKTVTFISDKFTISGNRFVESFPNYNSVIPPEDMLSHKFIADRASVIKGVKYILPFVDSSTKRVDLKVEEGKVTIYGQDVNYSTEGNYTVDCNYQGESIDIAFTAKDFLPILEKISGNDIEICFVDKTRPGVFRPLEQIEGTELCAILVPLL